MNSYGQTMSSPGSATNQQADTGEQVHVSQGYGDPRVPPPPVQLGQVDGRAVKPQPISLLTMIANNLQVEREALFQISHDMRMKLDSVLGCQPSALGVSAGEDFNPEAEADRIRAVIRDIQIARTEIVEQLERLKEI